MALRDRFTSLIPKNAVNKAALGHTLGQLKGVREWLADAVEATQDLEVVEALAKASPWAEAAGKALGDALPPVKFLLKLFEHLGKVEDPADLGYLAATLAYQRAVEQALPEILAEAGVVKGTNQEVKVRKGALKELREAASPETYDFARFSFDTALADPFVKDADQLLELSSRGLGLDEAGFRHFQHQVHLRFLPNLKGILSHGKTRERFAPFRELMALDTSQARAQDALLEHADYQRWLFEEYPVLGSEPFTLRQVYTETDCGLLRWGNVARNNLERGDSGRIQPFLEEFGGRQPLVKTLLDLIGDPNFDDAIVMQGVAGSGKSAMTLRLAWELVRQGLRPIRIELKHLNTRPEANIEESLPQAVYLTDMGRSPEAVALSFGRDLFLQGTIFDESVNFRGTKICPYVLILDGWDEINVGASEGYQQQVTRMLDGIRQEFLRNRPIPVRVLLAGRPTNAIQDSKFLRAETRLLTVRNLNPKQLEAYVKKVKQATAHYRGKGSWNLSEVALPKVLERYQSDYENQKKSQEERGSPEGPTGSLEILGLPLLAHLALRLLAKWPEKAQTILEDTTSLFRRLVDMVIGKAGKAEEARFDPTPTAMLQGKELRRLLRGTAEAMTHLGIESISRAELEVRLGLEEDELQRRFASLSGDQVLTRLMISFFFKAGSSEGGLEFSHKSFREYLFAEQVVAALKDYGRQAPEFLSERDTRLYWKDFEDGDPRKDLCHRLAELLSPVWTTPEVGRHLQQLLSWEISRSARPVVEPGERTVPLSTTEWRRVRDGLADAWDWWGEGVHLRPQPARRPRYREWDFPVRALALDIAENARLRSDPQVLPTPPRITTMDAHFGDALCLLAAITHFQVAVTDVSQSVEEQAEPRRYQRLRYRGKEPIIAFAPSGLSKDYFSNYAARINAAGFRPAGRFPSLTAFRGVDLKRANLSRANFRSADLRSAELSLADLGGAYLEDADLRGANLIKAYLAWAFFREANLRGAKLDGAFLDGADLSSAKHLDSRELQATLGDEYTRLPEDLERPTDWPKKGKS